MAGWTKVSSTSNGATGTTLVLGSIPAGSHIVVRTYNGGAAPSISDGSGDTGASTYTVAKSQANTSDGGTLQEVYLYPTVNTASRTITSTVSCHMTVSWWTPPTSTTAVAASSTNGATTSVSATSIASGNVTAALGDLVSGACDTSNNGAQTWTAGGTSAGGSWATDVQTTEGNHVVYSQFVVATAGGTFSSQPVCTTADGLASIAVVYAATVSGGASTIPNLVMAPYIPSSAG